MGNARANLTPRGISSVWLAQQAIKYNLPAAPGITTTPIVTKLTIATKGDTRIGPPPITVQPPVVQPFVPPPTPILPPPPAILPQVQDTVGGSEPVQPRGLNRCGITNPVAAASEDGKNGYTVTPTVATQPQRTATAGALITIGGAIMTALAL